MEQRRTDSLRKNFPSGAADYHSESVQRGDQLGGCHHAELSRAVRKVNTTLIAGLFRAGGDSRFGLICDAIDMWCYAVPLGFIAAFALKLPPMVVYFLLCTDEFVKWPWVLKRYRSKKWLKNITREEV